MLHQWLARGMGMLMWIDSFRLGGKNPIRLYSMSGWSFHSFSRACPKGMTGDKLRAKVSTFREVVKSALGIQESLGLKSWLISWGIDTLVVAKREDMDILRNYNGSLIGCASMLEIRPFGEIYLTEFIYSKTLINGEDCASLKCFRSWWIAQRERSR